MGNRAVIATENKDVGVYVHWEGGRRSIDGFLAYCYAMKFRAPEDDEYGWARLCQVIANWFGPDGLFVGINRYENLDTDNGDNGVYIIKNWKIVKRIYNHGRGKTPTELSSLIAFMLDINSRQPENAKLSESQISAAATDYLTLYENDNEKALPKSDTKVLPTTK